MVSDSEVTFRLQGIPRSLSRESIEHLLSHQFRLGESGSRADVFPLAPNPLRLSEQVGTLSFTKIPEELQRKEEKPIDLKDRDGSRKRLVLNSHFEGFTPLHFTPDADCMFDIIAISGLHGHAFGSFKQRGEAYMWLRDSLPYDVPQARIFLYGYETQKPHCQTVDDLGKAFRRALEDLRDDSQPPRPLVIVAHSLGGLIVKSALIDMEKSERAFDRANSASIRGLLFFGVPSQGMNIESIIPMVGEPTRRSLIDSLDAINSPVLRHLEQFSESMSSIKGLESIYFYETVMSPTAKKVEDAWKMVGPPAVLVSPQSATLARFRDQEGYQAVPVSRPHSELVKFTGSNDVVYETVRKTLRKIGKTAANREQIKKLSIPSDMLGSIIGRGGKKISEIRTVSGARITISDVTHDRAGSRMVTIMGSPDSTKRAVDLIYEKLGPERMRQIQTVGK